jgi:hypothetical protein
MATPGTYGSARTFIKERGTRIMPVLPGLSVPFTQGNVWHVKPYSGSDSNYGDHPDSAFKTLTQAQSAATANQNDIVLMYYESNTAASTTDYQSTNLAWAKDNVHLVGVGDGSFLGQRSRIAQLSTALTISDLFTVSANNCIIAGLEIYQGIASAAPTTSNTCRAMVVSGMRNKVINCQISGIGDLSMDLSSSCSLAVTGAENQFIGDYIGLDTVLRTTSVSEINISTNATRTLFDDCIVNSYVATAATTFKAITIAAGSYHTATFLRNTILCSETNRTGCSAAQTGAFLHNAAGNVFMLGGGVFGYLNVSTVTNAAIFLLSYAGLATHATLPGIAAGQQTT